MFKFLSIFLVFFYIVPFTLASKGYFFEYLQVLAIVAAFFLGGFLLSPFVKGRELQNYKDFFVPSLKILLLVIFVYGILRASYIFEVVIHLFRGDFANWALQNAVDRYEGVQKLGKIYNIGTVFFIAYAFMLGAYGFRKKTFFLWLVFFLMLLVESSGLARAGVLLALSALCTEYVIRLNIKLGNMGYFLYFKYYIFLVIILFGVFIFSAYFRYAQYGNFEGILQGKFLIYTIAMYQAMYVWMSSLDSYMTGYGINTLTSVYKIFGYVPDQGFYQPVTTDFGQTNIFTNLRALLSDFGFFVSSLIFMTFGFMVRYFSYFKMELLSYLSVRTLIYFVLFLIFSPFYFTTVSLGFFLSFSLIFFCRRERVLFCRR